jgi:plastocyanin
MVRNLDLVKGGGPIAERSSSLISKMQRRRVALVGALVLAAVALAACSDSSSNFGKYYQGRTLHVSVAAVDRAPELRYATIDPGKVVRHWRLTPSAEALELVLVRLKVENHSAVSAVVNVDEQAAELRDFVRGSFFPVDLGTRLHQDLRGQPVVTVHVSRGQCFDPNRVTIAQGTTVEWVNDDSVVQSLKLDLGSGAGYGGGEVAPAAVGPGESFSHTFDSVGAWDYTCGAPELQDSPAQVKVEAAGRQPVVRERSMLFLNGPFELLRGTGIDGWMVFEAPKGTRFRDLRWMAGDVITITF